MCVELNRRGFLRTVVSATGMLAAAGVLAACGSVPAASSAAPAARSAPVTSSSPPAANAASAAPPSAAAAASHGELKLGILANTSGPFAAIGDDMNRATELYLEQHGGSLGGFKFNVIREDEGASPADALSKARKLMQQDHVDVLMGIVLSSTALALRDPITQAKLPTIVTNAGAVELSSTHKSPYIFRTSFTNWQTGTALSKWTYDNAGKKALVMAPDYAAGHECAAAFMETFKQSGGTIVDQIYPPLGNTDYGPFLGKVKNSSPEVVWAFFSAGDAIKFMQQWSQFIGTTIPLVGFGLNTVDVVNTIQKLALLVKGADTNWDPSLDNAQNKQFVEAFKKKYGKTPSFANFQWDGMIFLDKALQLTNGDKSPAALVETMGKVGKFNGVQGELSMDADGHSLTQPFYRTQTFAEGSGYVTRILGTLGTFAPLKVISWS